MRYNIAALSEIGTRATQQDSVQYKEDIQNKPGQAFAVLADGMGGLRYGEDISSLLTSKAVQFYDAGASEGENFPQSLVLPLNHAVLDFLSDKEGQGGSTLIMVYLDGAYLRYASVGDSKLFLLRDGWMYRVNCDHNFGRDLDELCRMGKITPQEAAENVQRNALTSYMGSEKVRMADCSLKPYPIYPGDRILMLSDGVLSALREEEIMESLVGRDAIEQLDSLKRAVIAKERRVQDNYSAIEIIVLE